MRRWLSAGMTNEGARQVQAVHHALQVAARAKDQAAPGHQHHEVRGRIRIVADVLAHKPRFFNRPE